VVEEIYHTMSATDVVEKKNKVEMPSVDRKIVQCTCTPGITAT